LHVCCISFSPGLWIAARYHDANALTALQAGHQGDTTTEAPPFDQPPAAVAAEQQQQEAPAAYEQNGAPHEGGAGGQPEQHLQAYDGAVAAGTLFASLHARRVSPTP